MAGEIARSILLAQIMAEISAQTNLLEAAGKQAGLDWLKQHGGFTFPGHLHLNKCNQAISLDEFLCVWFAQVPPPRAVLLFHFLMNELSRWQHVDEVSAAGSLD